MFVCFLIWDAKKKKKKGKCGQRVLISKTQQKRVGFFFLLILNLTSRAEMLEKVKHSVYNTVVPECGGYIFKVQVCSSCKNICTLLGTCKTMNANHNLGALLLTPGVCTFFFHQQSLKNKVTIVPQASQAPFLRIIIKTLLHY